MRREARFFGTRRVTSGAGGQISMLCFAFRFGVVGSLAINLWARPPGVCVLLLQVVDELRFRFVLGCVYGAINHVFVHFLCAA